MINFFNKTGSLRVVLGKGYISAYELSTRKVGDAVFVGDRLCGEYVSLYFNNQHLAEGDLILYEGRIGFRITKLAFSEPGLAFPGSIGDLGEILDSEFVVCQRSCRFIDIQGLKTNGVIDFGPEEGITEQGLYKSLSVWVAGQNVMQGQAIVAGETWGIKIENIKNDEIIEDLKKSDLAKEIPVRTTFKIGKDDELKPYDFSRPDRFSRDQLESARQIHKRLAHNMKLSGLSPVDVEVYSVDQLTWGEFIEYGEKDNIKYTKALITGREIRARHPARFQEGKFFLPMEGCSADEALTLESRFRQEAFIADSAIPLGQAQIIFQGEQAAGIMSRAFIMQLESSWRDRVTTGIDQLDKSKNIFSKFLKPYDMILLVSLKMAGSDDDFIHLVYPYIYLQKILHLLG